KSRRCSADSIDAGRITWDPCGVGRDSRPPRDCRRTSVDRSGICACYQAGEAARKQLVVVARSPWPSLSWLGRAVLVHLEQVLFGVWIALLGIQTTVGLPNFRFSPSD